MMKVRSRVLAAAIIGLSYLSLGSVASAGTIMPPGETTFFDNNGQVLSAGCIYFYVPGTFTPKDTFMDAGQTTANTNPVQLDAAGRAIIYGTGTYRQIVKAAPCGSLGVTIWDQLTAATDTSNTIFAGASAGTPNAITVTAPAFSGTDGQVINYISTNTSTAAATFNPSGFGAVPIVRDSATGPQSLTGGELVATNAVSLIYDATAGTFHILSPVTWPTTGGVPVGTTIMVRGFATPTNYAFTYGQAISRTTFASLFAVLTNTQSGSLSSGSPTITGLTDTIQFFTGMAIESVGIPAGTTVLSCTTTTCTMSANATATRTGAITFFAYGNGDGSTTFNLPDDRGRVFAGRDNMGGSAKGVLTSTYYGGLPTGLGSPGGSQNHTLTLAEVPTGITSNGTMSGSAVLSGSFIITQGTGGVLVNGAGGGGGVTAPQVGTAAQTSSLTVSGTASVTSNNTSGSSHSIIPPAVITNYAIRLTP